MNDAHFNKTFDVALHVGTLVGAVVYFRHDLWRYLIAWIDSIAPASISTTDERIAWALVVGTIPGAIVGAVFEERDPGPARRAMADRDHARDLRRVLLRRGSTCVPATRHFETPSVSRTGLVLGVAQALALQPGRVAIRYHDDGRLG